ncbi:hypothetical protein MPP7335_02362 [Mycolicibacterium parafortuitum]|uniref:Uncharacterized protein n=1 Tax=Mycolicibacterium parafortuitum TaxID=39692 RepID=A0A375YHM5_MYCPF|nr:hypothetical protein MPP7335_02362 [Mycolicibacterium parafortuitum]
MFLLLHAMLCRVGWFLAAASSAAGGCGGHRQLIQCHDVAVIADHHPGAVGGQLMAPG